MTRLIDADALSKKLNQTTIIIKDGEVFQRMINDAPTIDAVQLKQTDTLIISVALRYLSQDEERHELDRARAEKLRKQILEYGASMCHAESYKGGELK